MSPTGSPCPNRRKELTVYKCKECKHFNRCTQAQTLYIVSNEPTVYYCDDFKQQRVSRINWPFIIVYGSCLVFWAALAWIAATIF